MDNIKEDLEVFEIMQHELERQRFSLEMIPSENFTSPAVMMASGSVLTNKYSEGYPGKRYYGGNQFIDEIERLAINRAKSLFNVPYANVQPYSGSPANFAVYMATCSPNDTIMGLNLSDGGHLTHGWKSSATGQIFRSISYHVNKEGYIDIEEAQRLAIENKPKLIWIGATAYPRELPFKEFADIAEECGAYLAADISHISGLIVGKMHKSPIDYADIITTTTHKTLRGPRGAIIMVSERGMKKDIELTEKINKAIFPGLQGGPHDNTTAAIAIALKEASTAEFTEYARQIVVNAKALAASLIKNNVSLVSNGTDNHLLLIDLTPFGKGKGIFVQEALDMVGITVNKNTIPMEPSSPFYPSGIRLGTPAITTRGMKEDEMEGIGRIIANVINISAKYNLPEGKEEKLAALKSFRSDMALNEQIKSSRKQVIEMCKKFPLYQNISI